MSEVLDNNKKILKPRARRGPKPGTTNNPKGRPKGSGNKISGQAILDAIAAVDVPFEVGLANDYLRARMGDDRQLVAKYQQMILNKVVADKAEVDLTSGGGPIVPVLNIIASETGQYANRK